MTEKNVWIQEKIHSKQLSKLSPPIWLKKVVILCVNDVKKSKLKIYFILEENSSYFNHRGRRPFHFIRRGLSAIYISKNTLLWKVPHKSFFGIQISICQRISAKSYGWRENRKAWILPSTEFRAPNPEWWMMNMKTPKST